MSNVYISNDINCPCNIKKCTTETIESCCGCPEWFIWNYDIEQSDKRNPKQVYVGKHLKTEKGEWGIRKTVTQKTEIAFDNPNEKEEYLPFLPLMLLAALYSNLIEFENHKQTDEEIRRNCPSIEWEQDMGAHIPFCKIYGGMCNMQCL